jgi:hypothetical protein
MNRLLPFLLALLVADLAGAEGTNLPKPTHKLTFPESLFFSSISISNDSVLATMPLTQIRFLSFLNGTNAGFVSPSQVFILQSGDELRLADKHWRITAIPAVTATNAELKVIQVFDGRSFGDSVKTNSGTVKLR